MTKRCAIVTGSSRGIGKAIALRLAQDGFAVVVNYAGNAQKAEETVYEIKSAGGVAIHLQGDVASLSDMEQLFQKTQETYGQIDVVVNSAGIISNKTISDLDLSDFDKIIHTNLRGSFIVLGLAAKYVGSGGRIIALSTSVIAKSPPGYGAYVASKLGVEGLVHVLANELRGKNITLNAVSPGPVSTELFFQGKNEETIEMYRKLPPLERLGEPDDIAHIVSFLASPDGLWLNSQIIRANGGYAW